MGDLACPYFTRYLNLGGLQSPRRPNYYPGVFGFLQIVSAEQTLVYYAALDLLAENQTTGDCGTCDVHSDCVRGRCVLRHAWFHHALSPALEFVRNGYVYFDQAPET